MIGAFFGARKPQGIQTRGLSVSLAQSSLVASQASWRLGFRQWMRKRISVPSLPG